MRVSTSEASSQPHYPKLLSYRDMNDPFVVLMHSPGRGIVLVKGASDYEVGTYHASWSEAQFEAYTRSVTLQN